MHLVILGGFLSEPLNSAESNGRAEYVGGTLSGLPENASGHIRTTDEAAITFHWKHFVLQIPYERINLIEYGQKVDRRYVMAALVSPVFVLSKRRRHFLTIGFTDGDGAQQALVVRVEKDRIRPVLVVLEARTGRKVQYQDEEARKAGKG